MHESTDIHKIIASYLNGSLSEAEQGQLQQWIGQSPKNKQLFDQLTQHHFLAEELQKLYAYDEDKGWERIGQYLAGERRTIQKRNPWRLWAVAASVTGLLLVAGYIFFNRQNKPAAKTTTAAVQHDVPAPATSKAVIKLANGQTVSLDSINSGLLAGQGNVHVIKNADGQIVYKGAATETVYNTLVNPRGGTVVSLVLQDGSKVWLNSESSLRYPVAFTGAERKVEITGEAYFEVAKDPAKKFIVTGQGVQTEVLGTHFNINTYTDEEQVRVTLIEGSVRVANGAGNVKLKPGEQAAITHDSRFSIAEVDTDRIIAWTTGSFYFDEEDLSTVMRQLARWYDVDVSFSGIMPQDHYSGIFSRQLTLSKVLTVLKMAGVKYTIDGKKLKIEKVD